MKAYNALYEKLLSAFSAACLIVLLLMMLAIHLSREASTAIAWVQHSYEVLNSVVQARSDTIQIELSTHTYRITGDEQHIIERDKLVELREKALLHLKQATADNADQQQRWQQLRAVIDERLAITKNMVFLRKHQGLDAANAYIATSPLQETRERIYRLWQEMEDEERRLLSDRLAAQERSKQQSIAVMMAVGILLMTLLIMTFLLIRKQLKDIYLSRKALAESESKLSTTLHSIGDGVLATDTQGRITRMNAVAERLTGWSLADAQGRLIEEVFQIFNELTGQPALIPVQKAMESRTVHGLEKNTVLADRHGNLTPIADSAAPILDTHGMVLGVVLVFRDISQERKAELEIQAHNNRLEKEVERRTAELRSSAENLRKVTDHVPALIAYVDAQQHYVYANQRYIDRFASEIAQIEGLSVKHVLGQRRYKKVLPYIEQVLAGQAVSYDWEPFPHVWQMVNYVPTTAIDGMTRGYYVLIADITDRKLAELAFYKVTHFDALTGLPNEAQFTELLIAAIEHSRKNTQSFALVQINIEKLSEINDALGFTKGDQVLKKFAARLKRAAPPDSKIGRLRGDEFAILLSNHSEKKDALVLVNQLESVLEEAIVVSGIALDISAKIGIALFPEHGLSPHDLYRHTDFAVRQAKKKGVRYQVFDHTLDSDKPHRLALAADLRRSIDQNALTLYLQPKIALHTGKICGAEALIRWHHPERGPVSPAEFIPLAEQIGLIKPITQWVLNHAMSLIHDFNAAGLHMPVAINLSARNLHEEDLVERIHALQDHWHIAPNQLEIEVTETSVMEDAQHALKLLHLFRAQGIPLSIDDFGTGYSSLSYLQRLPVQFIKIDQSFVQNMLSSKESLMIVRSTIELAHALDKQVVAEGVETREQWEKLAALGCDIAQGYWIAKPMPADAFIGWVQQQSLS